MHQGEQPESPQGDRLPAGVRAGHDEGRVAVAEPDVDRDDPPGETGMARPEQDDLGSVGRLGPDAVHLGGQARLGGPQVEPGEGVERLPELRGVGRHERRQLVEDPLDLLALGRLGLPPRVAELDRDERLDEQRLTAPGRVVDDPLHPTPCVGLDRDHVATVAQGDQGLLEGARGRLRLDQRLEPAAEPVVGDPDRRPKAAESRRRAVEELADRIEAPGERAPQGRQRVELPTEVAQERPTLLGKGGPEPGDRVERVGDPQEVARIEPAAPRRPADPRADVVRGADADRRAFAEECPGLVGLVERPSDDDRVVRRLERLGQPASGREGRRGGQPLAHGRELEQADRLDVHQAGARGPDSEPLPAMANRHGRLVHGSPA